MALFLFLQSQRLWLQSQRLESKIGPTQRKKKGHMHTIQTVHFALLGYWAPYWSRSILKWNRSY